MALTKKVNGEEVVVDGAEETAILNEWTANDPTLPANLIPKKKERIRRIFKDKEKQINENNRRIVLLAKALKIMLKYITITDQADTDSLLALRDEFTKNIDLENYAKQLETAVENDPVNTDVETGWPL